MPVANIGIGSNLDGPLERVAAAMDALETLGTAVRKSAIYRTAPWGDTDQPDFMNAVVALQTPLLPRELFSRLKALEVQLGREANDRRWGPRAIDFDILTYDDIDIHDVDLTIPHPRLFERAFALVPLAEVDERFAAARDALPREARSGVTLAAGPAGSATDLRETVALMSEDHNPAALVSRVRRLAGQFVETDLLRLRIEREGDSIELGRRSMHPDLVPEIPADLGTAVDGTALHLDAIKSDLVGIFRFSRPALSEGDLLEGDRELAFIEALGIRNPVRSLGPGRVVSIKRSDGDAVEYGAVLFEIDRG